ncbi:MAG TPA: GTPase HflX [Tepidisphaeraceae bacterium]|jgi:GTP-binding protein HflX
MSELKRTKLSVKQERAILVGVILPDSTADSRDPLAELGSLAKTAGARVAGSILQRRHRVDPSTYIGSGKAIEIAHLAKQEEADVVLFDNDLSPGQIGALEKVINKQIASEYGQGVKILDRSELILDIFASRAQTYEAKLQVELAQLEYTYPRLARMWSHLERLSASGAGMGIGTRGPGEKQIETDRRIVRRRIADLKSEIKKVQERKSRLVAERTRKHFTVCIVGYTNAGKSTLFNTLTAAGTYADDKLFATLDTKTRAWKIDRGVEVLLSDTVGFVRDLPHNLVASFKATLEEAIHADLLLHVLDVGHPHAQQQYRTVHEVLNEIGAKDKPELLLLNKIDTDEGEEAVGEWQALYPDAIPISAKSGRGLGELGAAVAQFISTQYVEAVLEADSGNGRLLAFLEAHCRIHQRDFFDSRVRLQASVPRRTLAELARNEQITIERAG